ncbi:MAG TPA: hypothetical protein VG370_25025 [Chloroflexota bacterium]|jgi:hypothetical protein|nr:hypothetical protein [Chloroflexota bacterium]
MKIGRIASVLVLLSVLVLTACSGGGGGLPPAPGKYPLKEKSTSFDGERYAFYWADGAGNLHRAHTDDVKLRVDETSFLEITAAKEAVLHLKQDEPITVEARDRQGDFGGFWYPFLIGSMLSRGPVVINQPAPREYQQPVYRYPPTDRFDRGDTIAGNATNTTNRPPDYSRLAPVGGAVSGQTGGAGGGNAATNKAQTAPSSGGQVGGTGSGSAALDKTGSFKAGAQGYDAKAGKVGAGSGLGSGRTGPSIGSGKSSTGAKLPSISTGRRR